MNPLLHEADGSANRSQRWGLAQRGAGLSLRAMITTRVVSSLALAGVLLSSTGCIGFDLCRDLVGGDDDGDQHADHRPSRGKASDAQKLSAAGGGEMSSGSSRREPPRYERDEYREPTSPPPSAPSTTLLSPLSPVAPSAPESTLGDAPLVKEHPDTPRVDFGLIACYSRFSDGPFKTAQEYGVRVRGLPDGDQFCVYGSLLGGSPMETRPSDLISGSHRFWTLRLELGGAWMPLGQHMVTPYVGGNVSLGMLFWDYRNDIISQGDKITNDALSFSQLGAVLGVRVDPIPRVAVHAEVSPAVRWYSTKTGEGFENDLKLNSGIISYSLGISAVF